jgi:hypothetical protein
MPDKICFVVIGYGIKTDFRTGRQLDLDKTYQLLIKPVFDELGISCVRSCDIPHSGVIDLPMYTNILKADIVVADLSTLNANAIYELGVRHALRPNTTIVISEKQLPYPFDLNHILITQYDHMGSEIAGAEAQRFGAELKKLVTAVLDHPEVDSPVYTFLQQLVPPSFPDLKIESSQATPVSSPAPGTENIALSTLLSQAESLKNDKQFDEAIKKLRIAQQRDPNNPYITQRIALAIYKSKKPNAFDALENALKELQPLHPELTNDPETLGLCGAIYKRLYEETELEGYLTKARTFYERGFIIAKDYYNGINLAYLLLQAASMATTKEEKIAETFLAARIRQQVFAICQDKLNSLNFSEMSDRTWILLTLAEISFTNGNTDDEQKYLHIAQLQGAKPFELDSYADQKNKLSVLLGKLKK